MIIWMEHQSLVATTSTTNQILNMKFLIFALAVAAASACEIDQESINEKRSNRSVVV